MSKVNFVSEFNSFMRYARDNSLSLRERMLWIALFYIANDRAMYNEQTQEYDWPDDFIQVSNGELNLYCCLDKRAIETLRNGLKQRGLIDFQPGQKNKRNPAYKINYLSAGNIGDKTVPNNTPNNAPTHVPNNTPNNAPNRVPDAAPSRTGYGQAYGTNLHPTMPPYTQNRFINQSQKGGGTGANAGSRQNTPRTEMGGFVDLDEETPGCDGFVPLPWEEGYA